MTWGSLILALLKLAASLAGMAREKQLLKAGQDQAIAQASLRVLEVTQAGKELRERVQALDDTNADQLWENMLKHGNS